MSATIVSLFGNIPQVNIQVKPCHVKWSLCPTTQATVSHQLVPVLSKEAEGALRSPTLVLNPSKKPGTVFQKVVEAPRQPKTVQPLNQLEEQIFLKNSIATPIQNLFNEEEPETIEAVFDIIVAIEEGKVLASQALFRKLAATQGSLLSKFNRHLRNLNEETGVEDPLEFCGDITKTKQALFAIAYNGKSIDGEPNTYSSPKAMKSWIAGLHQACKKPKRAAKK
jgi:hypothetical protein